MAVESGHDRAAYFVRHESRRRRAGVRRLPKRTTVSLRALTRAARQRFCKHLGISTRRTHRHRNCGTRLRLGTAMSGQDYVALEGSHRDPPPEPRIAAAPEQEVIKVTVHLRDRATQKLNRLVARLSQEPPDARQHLTRDQFAQQFGARPADIAAVRRFAADHDLNVVSVHPERRTVQLSGTVAAMSEAFGVDLGLHRSATGVYRGRTGSIHVPRDLAPAIVAVLGLDSRPAASPHFRFRQVRRGGVRPSADSAGWFTAPQVASLYHFPGRCHRRGSVHRVHRARWWLPR